MKEVEAKFLVAGGKAPKRTFRRVLQELSWAGYLARPQGQTLVVDGYFDTDEWHLQRQGWTYRLRRDPNGETLTLKQIGEEREGIFERQEVEQPLDTPLHQPERPPPGRVAERLGELLNGQPPLDRLFELQNHRTRYHLIHPDFPGALVELSLDQVDIDAKDRLAFTELEFELVRGPEAALHDLVNILNQQPSLILARVGKYQRGLQAAGRIPTDGPEPVGVTNVRGRWLDLALQHLNLQLRCLKYYEPLAWESLHPEGVHQMRVATRRVRAALRAFGNVLPPAAAEQLTADIRTLTRTLGPVRDLDVHLEHLHGYRRSLTVEQRPALRRYQRHLERKRRKAHRRLVDTLASESYAQLIDDYRKLLDAAVGYTGPNHYMTVQQAAQAEVEPVLTKVLKRGTAITPKSRPEKLHRLRIDVKRLRYLLEYLLTPYGGRLDRPAKLLRRLQETLGDHQDAHVARAQLTAYAKSHDLVPVEESAFARLLELERQNAEKHRGRFDKHWRRFEGAARHLMAAL